MKFSKIIYTIFFSLLILSYFRVNALAHDSLNGNFLFLNSESLALSENLNPKTYVLKYYAHFLKESLEINKEYVLDINTQNLKEYLELETDITVIWNYEDKVVEGSKLTLNFDQPKSIIFEFLILSEGEELITESFLLNFGETSINTLTFKVDGNSNSQNKVISVLDNNLNLEVENPKETSEYIWEVDSKAISNETNFEYKVEDSTPFPLYIFLREIDKESNHFIDSYAKLELSKSEIYKINTPPVLINQGDVEGRSDKNITFSIIGLTVVILMIIGLLFLKKKKKI